MLPRRVLTDCWHLPPGQQTIKLMGISMEEEFPAGRSWFCRLPTSRFEATE